MASVAFRVNTTSVGSAALTKAATFSLASSYAFVVPALIKTRNEDVKHGNRKSGFRLVEGLNTSSFRAHPNYKIHSKLSKLKRASAKSPRYPSTPGWSH